MEANQKKKPRVILHADCNSFFASVESIDHPEYNLVPMAVGGDPEQRHGIILAKNELAKKYNIKTAETLWSAKRKCPDLLIVPAHHHKYSEVSKRINAIYAEYTDRIEPFSVDESWLDVTESLSLFGDGKTIADTLRKRIREEIGITISVGVSYTKTFAKMGSDYKKPDATTVITPENYKEILWPLPVGDMMFVGEAAAKRYQEYGIKTIGDLAQAPYELIVKINGKSGTGVWYEANGLGSDEVALFGTREDPKSISHMVTFSHDLVNTEEVRTELLELSDEVGTRLREHGFFASVISIQIKDPELNVRQKQKKISGSTDLTRQIYQTAWDLCRTMWKPGQPIRMLTVGVSGFSKEGFSQGSLFEPEQSDERQEALEHTLDQIRKRYGSDAVKFARTRKKSL